MFRAVASFLSDSKAKEPAKPRREPKSSILRSSCRKSRSPESRHHARRSSLSEPCTPQRAFPTHRRTESLMHVYSVNSQDQPPELMVLFEPVPQPPPLRPDLGHTQAGAQHYHRQDRVFEVTAKMVVQKNTTAHLHSKANKDGMPEKSTSGHLRRQVYLAIMSSSNHEECVEKLIKLNVTEEQEVEVSDMLLDCSTLEKDYTNFFALQAELLCKMRSSYQTAFTKCIHSHYAKIQQYEAEKAKSIARFFGFLIACGALPLVAMECFVLTAEDISSAARNFIRHTLQEIHNAWGAEKFKAAMKEAEVRKRLQGLIPLDHHHAQRAGLCIAFFASIGLAYLVESLRSAAKTENCSTHKVVDVTPIQTTSHSCPATQPNLSNQPVCRTVCKVVCRPTREISESEEESSDSSISLEASLISSSYEESSLLSISDSETESESESEEEIDCRPQRVCRVVCTQVCEAPKSVAAPTQAACTDRRWSLASADLAVASTSKRSSREVDQSKRRHSSYVHNSNNTLGGANGFYLASKASASSAKTRESRRA